MCVCVSVRVCMYDTRTQITRYGSVTAALRQRYGSVILGRLYYGKYQSFLAENKRTDTVAGADHVATIMHVYIYMCVIIIGEIDNIRLG